MGTRVFKYRDIEFHVTEPEKGCYSEVTLPGLGETVYVGINLHRPSRGDFCWTIGSNGVQESGLTSSIAPSNDLDAVLVGACSWLLERKREQDGRDKFDREAACDKLKVYVSGLPSS